MALDVRLFIDFWNFQLNWNERSGGAKCDWKAVPGVLLGEVQSILSSNGLDTAQLHETRVYASYERGRENKLKNWLDSFLDKQPGYSVIVRERHWRQKAIHCRACDTKHEECPTCKAKLGRASEKMVDSRIVADLLSLAWDGSYDLALLLTSDADMAPAVQSLQRHNFKVVNATWKGHGHELAKVSWASFELGRSSLMECCTSSSGRKLISNTTAAKKPRTEHGPSNEPKLPIIEEIFDLEEADAVCPRCGGELEAREGTASS